MLSIGLSFFFFLLSLMIFFSLLSHSVLLVRSAWLVYDEISPPLVSHSGSCCTNFEGFLEPCMTWSITILHHTLLELVTLSFLQRTNPPLVTVNPTLLTKEKLELPKTRSPNVRPVECPPYMDASSSII